MEEEERAAQSAKLQELIRRGGPEDLQEANRLMKIMAGYDTRSKTDYRAKAAEEVGKVQQKARLLEERLEAFKPGDNMTEGDVYEELASALQSAHPKIQRMCEEESDDHEAVAKLLEINDSIHRTVERYKLMKKGDVDGAAKIARGTLGTSTGVGKNAANELSLIDKLNFCLNNDFERITYTEAIRILKSSKPNQKKQFKYLIDEWGADLQSEHERYLVEKHFKRPVILTDYPADIKSFYMRQNEPDEQGRKTVAAMDILFPGIGEIVGGSQREERLDRLTKRMEDMNIPQEELWWFLDTRRFGSAPHSGFGLGFERLVLFITGMTNIRDVIAFPRFPRNAEF